jgi:hypothetical protein
MSGGSRTVREARRQAHEAIARAHAPPDVDEDVRRVVPDWAEVAELVEGARQRGWTQAQIDYLTAVVGVTWTKAYRRGQRDRT